MYAILNCLYATLHIDIKIRATTFGSWTEHCDPLVTPAPWSR